MFRSIPIRIARQEARRANFNSNPANASLSKYMNVSFLSKFFRFFRRSTPQKYRILSTYAKHNDSLLVAVGISLLFQAKKIKRSTPGDRFLLYNEINLEQLNYISTVDFSSFMSSSMRSLHLDMLKKDLDKPVTDRVYSYALLQHIEVIADLRPQSKFDPISIDDLGGMKKIVQEARKNKDSLEAWWNDKGYKQYVEEVGASGVYLGEVSLRIFADAFEVNIEYQHKYSDTVIEICDSNPDRPTIRIYYSGEHNWYAYISEKFLDASASPKNKEFLKKFLINTRAESEYKDAVELTKELNDLKFQSYKDATRATRKFERDVEFFYKKAAVLDYRRSLAEKFSEEQESLLYESDNPKKLNNSLGSSSFFHGLSTYFQTIENQEKNKFHWFRYEYPKKNPYQDRTRKLKTISDIELTFSSKDLLTSKNRKTKELCILAQYKKDLHCGGKPNRSKLGMKSSMDLKALKLKSIARAYAIAFSANGMSKDHLEINICEIGRSWSKEETMRAFYAAGFKKVFYQGIEDDSIDFRENFSEFLLREREDLIRVREIPRERKSVRTRQKKSAYYEIRKASETSPTEEETAPRTEEEMASPTEEETAPPTKEEMASPTEEETAPPTKEEMASPTEEETAPPTKEEMASPTEEETAPPTEEETAPRTEGEAFQRQKSLLIKLYYLCPKVLAGLSFTALGAGFSSESFSERTRFINNSLVDLSSNLEYYSYVASNLIVFFSFTNQARYLINTESRLANLKRLTVHFFALYSSLSSLDALKGSYSILQIPSVLMINFDYLFRGKKLSRNNFYLMRAALNISLIFGTFIAILTDYRFFQNQTAILMAGVLSTPTLVELSRSRVPKSILATIVCIFLLFDAFLTKGLIKRFPITASIFFLLLHITPKGIAREYVYRTIYCISKILLNCSNFFTTRLRVTDSELVTTLFGGTNGKINADFDSSDDENNLDSRARGQGFYLGKNP